MPSEITRVLENKRNQVMITFNKLMSSQAPVPIAGIKQRTREALTSRAGEGMVDPLPIDFFPFILPSIMNPLDIKIDEIVIKKLIKGKGGVPERLNTGSVMGVEHMDCLHSCFCTPTPGHRPVPSHPWTTWLVSAARIPTA